MSENILYYRGEHKVKIVAQSEGYWIVEALEDFEESIGSQKTVIKAGEQRTLLPNLFFKRRNLQLTTKRHMKRLRQKEKSQAHNWKTR